MRLPLFASLALCLIVAGSAPADDCCGEMWLVHGLTAGCGARDPRVDYLGPDCCWMRADVDALLASLQPGVPLVIYAHGNPTVYRDAVRQTSLLRRQLARRACGRPFVLVGWLWPAPNDQVRIRLMRQYAARAELQAWHLGRFLQRVRPDVPVSLVGFSFGSRIVAGSLHLLAGGSLAGRCLPGASGGGRIPFRVTLLAPAMSNDWLLPGRRYGRALGQMESLVIGKNRRDEAMRFYGLLERGRGPQALGFTGPVGLGRLGVDRAKVRVIDFTRWVSEHEAVLYLSSRPFVSILARQAYLDGLPFPAATRATGMSPVPSTDQGLARSAE